MHKNKPHCYSFRGTFLCISFTLIIFLVEFTRDGNRADLFSVSGSNSGGIKTERSSFLSCVTVSYGRTQVFVLSKHFQLYIHSMK